jgi:lipopolysaccharide transport system permease protein
MAIVARSQVSAAAEQVAPAREPKRRRRYPRPQSSVGDMVRQSWESRHLFGALAVRMAAVRFSRTKFGRAWFFIRPFMTLIGMTLLFGGILGVSPSADVPYLVFLVFGLVGFHFFQFAVFWSTVSFDRYGRLLRKLDFPLLPVPIAATSIAFIDLAAYLVIGLGIVGYYLAADGTMYLEFGVRMLLAVLGLALCFLLAVGIGLFTSIFNAHARDVRYSIPYILQFWFFLTPVVYPLSEVPADYRTLAQLNPMTAPVDLIKEGLLGIGEVEVWSVGWSLGLTLTICAAGVVFFSRYATNFMGPAGWAQDEDSRREDDEDDMETM